MMMSLFFPLVDVVLSTSPFNHPQGPFIQMNNTDVTFLPNYNNMDPARLYVMILSCPPSLPRSRLWAGLGVWWPSQSHPVIQGLPVLESFQVAGPTKVVNQPVVSCSL